MERSVKKALLENRHLVLAGIFLLGLLLRSHGLADQPPTDDEAAAASAATNYLRTGLFGQVMWYHPPLRNFIILLSGKLFGGYSAWGLRGGSLLFGSLTVPLLGYLGQSLFRSRLIGYLAALFLCLDPIHITASREAFQETATMFFVVAGAQAAWHAIRKDSLPYCYLAGILFGLAVSSKWHGVFSWTVAAAAYVAAPKLIKDYAGEPGIGYRLLTALGAFVAVPVLIYVAVYLPWLERGYSLPEFVRFQAWLVKHQYYYQGTSYSESFVSVRAYEWFLWPTAWVDFVFFQGKPYINIAMGNFLLWGLTLPALYFAARTWLRTRDFGMGLLLALFSAQYVPLLLTTRSIWVFLPPVIQYAFVLTAFSINGLLESGKVTRKALAVYLCLVASLSAAMYPMATFRAYDYAYLRPLAELYTPHGQGSAGLGSGVP